MRLNCLMLTLSLELASSVFSGLLRASYCAFERFLYLFSHFKHFAMMCIGFSGYSAKNLCLKWVMQHG